MSDPASLRRTANAAGTSSLAVAATWQLEKHAWYVAYAALERGAIPPLHAARLHIGEHGWAEGIELPGDGWEVGDGVAIAAALEAHLAPLVDELSGYRPRRALWRSVGDRIAQAALWVPAIELAEEILAAPTAFHAPAGFELRDGEPFRRRTGCCLSHRCEGGTVCEDCPLATRPGCCRNAGSRRRSRPRP
jgi:FhuF 2Fe-2S C-terminal domain